MLASVFICLEGQGGGAGRGAHLPQPVLSSWSLLGQVGRGRGRPQTPLLGRSHWASAAPLPS